MGGSIIADKSSVNAPAPHPWNGPKRRTLLIGMAALATGCATRFPARTPPRLGLADITIMRELLADYAGTLTAVAAMGFTTLGFRLFGYRGPSPDEPAPRLKAEMVRAAGLEVGATILSVRNADYDRELDIAAEIGSKIVVISTAPPFIAGPKLFETTRAKFEAWLPELATIAEKARSRGLTLAYHNHPFDFTPLDGARPFDLIEKAIPPHLLSFELDLAWLWLAGIDPVVMLRHLGSRVVSMHWKDIDRSRQGSFSDLAVVPGQGDMNYPALLPQIQQITGVTGYIEVDKPKDGLATARAGAELVQKVLA